MTQNEIIADIIVSEGGSEYTNRPNDAGGPTKFGITIPALSDFLGQKVTWEEIYHLNEETAYAFYNYLFEKTYTSQMPECIQHAFFDSCTLDGFGGASGFLQKALVNLGISVTVDYSAGPLTVEATKSVNCEVLLDYFLNQRESYYRRRVIERPADLENLQGWLNRIQRLRHG